MGSQSKLPQDTLENNRKIEKIMERFGGHLTFRAYCQIKDVVEIQDRYIRQYFGIPQRQFEFWKRHHVEILDIPVSEYDVEFDYFY